MGKAAALLLLLATAGRTPGEEAARGQVASSPPAGAEVGTVGAQPPEAGGPRSRRRRGRATQEQRFQELVKGLKLDAAQQVEVRKALDAYREEVRKLATDSSDKGVSRVSELRAIGERAAERIRSVLTEEQKRLYGQPMPLEAGGAEGRRSLEEWLDVLRKQQNQGDT